MKIKNVLLLTKQSAYTLYFVDHNVTAGRKLSPILRKNQQRFKEAHNEHYATLAHVKKVLKEYKINFFTSYRGQRFDYKKYDLIITVGGDGTFLEAARWANGQKMLGVNSAPSYSVGRFCQTAAYNFEKAIQQILTSSAEIKKLYRLNVAIGKKKYTVPVLNEVLICHHNPAFLCRYHLKIGKKQEEQRSSGIWIATAAGSSGAILSAGGQRLGQYQQKFQYLAREIYGKDRQLYHLTKDVLSANSTIEVTSLMRKGIIFFDGPHYHLPFGYGEVVKIDLSAKPLEIFDL